MNPFRSKSHLCNSMSFEDGQGLRHGGVPRASSVLVNVHDDPLPGDGCTEGCVSIKDVHASMHPSPRAGGGVLHPSCYGDFCSGFLVPSLKAATNAVGLADEAPAGHQWAGRST